FPRPEAASWKVDTPPWSTCNPTMAAPAIAALEVRVPPQNQDAEEAVLGAMLLSPAAITAVAEILDASDFYRHSHGLIYKTALALYERGAPVDAITVIDALEKGGDLGAADGEIRVKELAASVTATANAAHYARIVREMATLRRLINAGMEVTQLGWDRPGET